MSRSRMSETNCVYIAYDHKNKKMLARNVFLVLGKNLITLFNRFYFNESWQNEGNKQRTKYKTDDENVKRFLRKDVSKARHCCIYVIDIIYMTASFNLRHYLSSINYFITNLNAKFFFIGACQQLPSSLTLSWAYWRDLLLVLLLWFARLWLLKVPADSNYQPLLWSFWSLLLLQN